MSNAERSVQRIAGLLKTDYRLLAPILAPLPLRSTADARHASLAAARAERHAALERFEQSAYEFFMAWAALGYDPNHSFEHEGQRLAKDWNSIAGECVGLAAGHFGVHFTMRTVIDEEHGTMGPIGSHHLAKFFVDPATVARIAEGKIRGDLRFFDGMFPAWKPSSAPEPRVDDRVGCALARLPSLG